MAPDGFDVSNRSGDDGSFASLFGLRLISADSLRFSRWLTVFFELAMPCVFLVEGLVATS